MSFKLLTDYTRFPEATLIYIPLTHVQHNTTHYCTHRGQKRSEEEKNKSHKNTAKYQKYSNIHAHMQLIMRALFGSNRKNAEYIKIIINVN